MPQSRYFNGLRTAFISVGIFPVLKQRVRFMQIFVKFVLLEGDILVYGK